jgi:hypothetical protein
VSLHIILVGLAVLALLLLLVEQQLGKEDRVLSLVLFDPFMKGLVFLDLIIKHSCHLV